MKDIEILNKIELESKKVIDDNNFLFVAFQSRLSHRLINIFEKYDISFNKSLLTKNLEENFINHMIDLNKLTLPKYVELLKNYDLLIKKNIAHKSGSREIKTVTISFIKKISEKAKETCNESLKTNFFESMKSNIMVYDNILLINEIMQRINEDTKEIIEEYNKNNLNFIIKSINEIIKKIIEEM